MTDKNLNLIYSKGSIPTKHQIYVPYFLRVVNENYFNEWKFLNIYSNYYRMLYIITIHNNQYSPYISNEIIKTVKNWVPIKFFYDNKSTIRLSDTLYDVSLKENSIFSKKIFNYNCNSLVTWSEQ